MKIDVASFKMEYEVARDRMVDFRLRFEKPPEWVPARMHESFLLGYKQGIIKSTHFDPIDDVEPPLELDWEFEGAWRAGYDDGCFSGHLIRESLLKRLIEQRGFKSTLL